MHPSALFALVPLATLALTTAPASAEPKQVTITMGNMVYGKIPADIHVGDTIVWTNTDTVIHSATARDHSFDIRANPGQSVKMVASKAGTIAFTCIFHPMMRGSLTVAP